MQRERFWRQIKADGDVDKTVKERGRSFYPRLPAPVNTHTHTATLPSHQREACVRACTQIMTLLATCCEVASLSGSPNIPPSCSHASTFARHLHYSKHCDSVIALSAAPPRLFPSGIGVASPTYPHSSSGGGKSQTCREGREYETSRTIEGGRKKGGSCFDECSCRAKGSTGHRH